jgi:hypothetical protein
MPVPFSKVTNMPKRGYRTPDPINPKTGRPDTIPSSGKNAVRIESPSKEELTELQRQQDVEELQKGFTNSLVRAANEADHAKRMANNPYLNGGRKTRRRRSRKSRRSRKH